jgi:hypothetical protein
MAGISFHFETFAGVIMRVLSIAAALLLLCFAHEAESSPLSPSSKGRSNGRDLVRKILASGGKPLPSASSAKPPALPIRAHPGYVFGENGQFNRNGTTNLWHKCIDTPILGQSCLDLWWVGTNLSLGVTLEIAGHVYLDKPLLEPKLCLNDATLLRLLEANPILLPFWPVIEGIILAEGLIPADVFSICVNVYNLDLSLKEAKVSLCFCLVVLRAFILLTPSDFQRDVRSCRRR